MRRSSILSSSLIVLLSLPLPAIAQLDIDNCIEITQPGSYKLTRNLPFPDAFTGLLPSGDCLLISASLVSIDLAGHTIDGEEEGLNGITGSVGLKDIRVTGGNILNFENGIDLGDSDDVTVHGMRLDLNFNEGIQVGNQSVVTENVVSNSEGPSDGPGITAGSGSQVIGNLVSNASVYGIDVGQESTVKGNNVRQTAAEPGGTGNARGIRVVCPSRVTDNSVTQTEAGNPSNPRDIKLVTPTPPLAYNFGHCFHLNNLGNVKADNDPGPVVQ